MKGNSYKTARLCYQYKVGSSCTASLLSDAAPLHKDNSLSFMCFGHMPKHIYFFSQPCGKSVEKKKKKTEKVAQM